MTTVFGNLPVPQIANGYACAYPLGVVGIIGATIAIRYITRTKLEEEENKLNEAEADNTQVKPKA